MTRFLQLILVTAAAAVSALSCPMARAESREVTALELPFERSPRGHLMVMARLDGGPELPFVVDTGAGVSVINRARLDQLGLEEQHSGRQVQRAHGSESLGSTEVLDFSLAGVSYGTMNLGVITLTGVEAGQFEIYGIIGFDLLSQHDLEIDFKAQTLVLHPPAARAEDCVVCDGDLVTDFELAVGTHIRFNTEISGASIATVLDTGSGRSAMNSLAAAAIGVELPESTPGSHGFGLRVGEMRLGGGTLGKNLSVGVVDLPVFEALGMADSPALLMGTNVLARRRVGISYGLNRISVR